MNRNPVLTLVLLLLLLHSHGLAEEEEHGRDTIGFGELEEEEWRGEVIHLSWRPRAFLYRGFLSGEECDHLIDVAKPHMERAGVVNDKTGEFEPSDTRTSTGAFLEESQDDVVARVERRVARVTMTPKQNQECMQVLRYADGQKYGGRPWGRGFGGHPRKEPHTDFFHDGVNAAPEAGGQRLVTALMYLSTPEEGGETVFPLAEPRGPPDPSLSECARRGLANRAVRGDMLVFYSLAPNGNPDPTSQHGSCPTTKGEKWSATIWVHTHLYMDRAEEGGFIKRKDILPPTSCQDSNEMCAEWAFFGECEKNPGYMLEGCPLSCGICRPEGHWDEEPAAEVKPPPPLEVLRRAKREQQ